MPINDISQKRILLNKIGLGTPKLSSNNIRISRQDVSQSQVPPKLQPPQQIPQPQPPKPNPPPAPAPKPGCGGCRRKRAS